MKQVHFTFFFFFCGLLVLPSNKISDITFRKREKKLKFDSNGEEDGKERSSLPFVLYPCTNVFLICYAP